MADLVAHLDQIVGQSPLHFLPDPFPEPVPIRLYLKRDDLLHPLVSGNKWRKLKNNLIEANGLGVTTLLTFGGAYSNHLYATAAAGRVFGFRTVGVVRGDELANRPLNPTLTFCREQGMSLHFVDRTTYLRAGSADFQHELQVRYGPCYILPEGGTNDLAIHGTAEIMPELYDQLARWPDAVACAVGTGGTLAGLIQSAPESVNILGISALKVPAGADVHFAGLPAVLPPNVSVRTDFHHGGYARTTPALRQFMLDFERKTGVLLEQIYTGKLLFALYNLARQGYFTDGANVVAIHTGGLQGRNF